MFVFSFLGFWLLRSLVKGHPTLTLDTDWLVRITGGFFLHFCKKNLVRAGSALDQRITMALLSVVGKLKSPKIEAILNPQSVGIGMLASLLLLAMFILYHV
jgi:hypothetical protein